MDIIKLLGDISIIGFCGGIISYFTIKVSKVMNGEKMIRLIIKYKPVIEIFIRAIEEEVKSSKDGKQKLELVCRKVSEFFNKIGIKLTQDEVLIIVQGIYNEMIATTKDWKRV